MKRTYTIMHFSNKFIKNVKISCHTPCFTSHHYYTSLATIKFWILTHTRKRLFPGILASSPVAHNLDYIFHSHIYSSHKLCPCFIYYTCRAVVTSDCFSVFDLFLCYLIVYDPYLPLSRIGFGFAYIATALIKPWLSAFS